MSNLEKTDLYKKSTGSYNFLKSPENSGEGGGVMQVLQGKAIMEQIVAGRLCFYRRLSPQI